MNGSHENAPHNQFSSKIALNKLQTKKKGEFIHELFVRQIVRIFLPFAISLANFLSRFMASLAEKMVELTLSL
jgi:hypothetical protein